MHPSHSPVAYTSWQKRIRWSAPAPGAAAEGAASAAAAPRHIDEDGIEWEVAALTRPPWMLQTNELSEVRALCRYDAVRRVADTNRLMGEGLGEEVEGGWRPPAPVLPREDDPAYARDAIAREEARRAAVQAADLEDSKRLIRVEPPPPECVNMPPPERLENGKKPNPDKPYLRKRRQAQFGGMLFAMGIWKARDLPPSEDDKKALADEAAVMAADINKPWHASFELPKRLCPLDVSPRPPPAGGAGGLQRSISSGDRGSGGTRLTPCRSSSGMFMLEYAEPTPLLRNVAGEPSVVIRLSRAPPVGVSGGGGGSKPAQGGATPTTPSPSPSPGSGAARSRTHAASPEAMRMSQGMGGSGTLPGIPMVLKAGDHSPLMASPGGRAGEAILFLHNSAMNVPIFEQPLPSAYATNRHGGGGGMGPSSTPLFVISQTSGQLRRVDATYVCGQVEPRVLAANPTSFAHDEKGSMKTYVTYTFLWDLYRSAGLSVPIKAVHDRFPFVQSSLLDTYVRSVAETQNRLAWRPIGFETKHETVLRREVLAKLEEMFREGGCEALGPWVALERGAASLRRSGIWHLLSSHVKPNVAEDLRVTITAYRMHRRARQLSLDASLAFDRKPAHPDTVREMNAELRAMKYVIKELMLSPWYQTNAFEKLFRTAEMEFNHFADGNVMQVVGFGDPSGQRGEMVSFLSSYRNPAPDDGHQQPQEPGAGDSDSDDEADGDGGGALEPDDIPQLKLSKKKHGAADGAVVSKAKIQKTDRDMRTLHITQLRTILMAIGIPEPEVMKIDRWDATWIIDQVASNSHGKHLLGGTLAKYARFVMPTGINDSVHRRHIMEQSDRFIAMREACTQAYQRLASAVRKACMFHGRAVILQRSASAPAASTSSSAGGGATATAARRAVRHAIAGGGGDALERDIQENLNEKRRLEQYKVELAQREVSKAKEAAYEASIRPLVSWLQGLSVTSATHPPPPTPTARKILQRIVIEVQADGRERVRAEYHLAPDAVRRHYERVADARA